MNFRCRGVLLDWMIVGQMPIELAIGGCLDIFPLIIFSLFFLPLFGRGWSGRAMVLGKLPVPGRPTIWITVGQGPTAFAVGAGGGCLDTLSPSLYETARYRLKYCLKGPLQPTNQLFGRRPDKD